MPKILEVCVDNYKSAIAAIEGGASRLELCGSLTDGGLTPTVGFLKQVKKINNNGETKIFCMLRCRNSNFIYSDEELHIMVDDAHLLKQNGADGFVFGALMESGEIDLRKCREIIKTCYPLPVTFHRAFDMCKNPLIKLETVIDLGFHRILTSGQEKSAELGIDIIQKLIKRAKNRIIIMPGAGVSRNNIKLLVDETEAEEYHGSFKITEVDADNNENQNLGILNLTDSCHVAEVVQILKTV